jgi:hypothetical protein
VHFYKRTRFCEDLFTPEEFDRMLRSMVLEVARGERHPEICKRDSKGSSENRRL